MLLYEISLHSQRIENTNLLYFRTDIGELHRKNGASYISIDQGGYVSFDTFMNVFSYSKFLRYTNLNCVKVTLNFKGKLSVSLVRCRTWRSVRSDFETEIIERRIVSSQEPSTVSFIWDFSSEPLAEQNLDRWHAVGKIDPATAATVGITGICYLHITSLEDGAEIYGGSYSTDIDETNKVKVGIGICTYKREDYVKANVQMLEHMMNKYSGLSEELGVFIADNGGTLSGEIKETDQVYLFPNLNYGGSGGFTRTLMEIWYRKGEYTHALLMDDDVVFEPTAILKTLAILKNLKEEFSLAHIGGAMLHISNPYYQFEMGSLWRDDKAKSFNRHDVSIKRKLIENEKLKPVNFNGWFFHCMPLSDIDTFGLPFPFFIKGDDIEYSLRSHAPIITMNGIGVWHEPYAMKYSSHLTYFDYRNKLVIQSIHQQVKDSKRVLRSFISRVKHCIYHQRYDEAQFVLLAMEDFLRGPDYFLQQKEDEKLKELLDMRTSFFYDKEELEKQGILFSNEEFRKRQKYTRKKFYQLIDKYTLNGTLFPRFLYKKELQTVSFGEKNARFFCRWKVILQWDPTRNMGLVTHDSFKKSFTLFLRLVKDCIKLKLKYIKIVKYFIKRSSELTSFTYWEQHLMLPKVTYGTENDRAFYPKIKKPNTIFTRLNRSAHSKVHRRDLFDVLYGNFYTMIHKSFKWTRSKKLQKYKDIHKGERCFIVATGPSLCLEDIEQIKNEYTFGVNSIFNLYTMTDWRPTYYVMCDASGYRRMEQKWDFENFCKDTAFLNQRIINYQKILSEKCVGFSFNHRTSEHYKPPTLSMRYEPEIDICIYDRCTVTNAAIDIALYMGFSEIYLLGVDHDYTGVRHFVPTEDDEKRKAPNLYHMRLSESGYKVSGENATFHHAEIYNSTRGGKLEIFERKRLW